MTLNQEDSDRRPDWILTGKWEDNPAVIERYTAVVEAARALEEVAGRVALISFANGGLSVAGKQFYAAKERLHAALAALDAL